MKKLECTLCGTELEMDDVELCTALEALHKATDSLQQKDAEITRLNAMVSELRSVHREVVGGSSEDGYIEAERSPEILMQLLSEARRAYDQKCAEHDVAQQDVAQLQEAYATLQHEHVALMERNQHMSHVVELAEKEAERASSELQALTVKLAQQDFHVQVLYKDLAAARDASASMIASPRLYTSRVVPVGVEIPAACTLQRSDGIEDTSSCVDAVPSDTDSMTDYDTDAHTPSATFDINTLPQEKLWEENAYDAYMTETPRCTTIQTTNGVQIPKLRMVNPPAASALSPRTNPIAGTSTIMSMPPVPLGPTSMEQCADMYQQIMRTLLNSLTSGTMQANLSTLQTKLQLLNDSENIGLLQQLPPLVNTTQLASARCSRKNVPGALLQRHHGNVVSLRESLNALREKALELRFFVQESIYVEYLGPLSCHYCNVVAESEVILTSLIDAKLRIANLTLSWME